MAKNNIKETAQGIVENLGGKDNVTSFSHCATRLRVYVKDESKINKEKLLKVPGVIAMDKATDQYQVILGQIVNDVSDEFQNIVGLSEGMAADKKEKKKGGFIAFLGRFFEFIAGIMQPVIPALVTAGLLKVLVIIISMAGIPPENPTYQMLNFISDVVFYFLPVFVAYSSAKKFKTDTVIALILACALLSPGWTSIVAAGEPMKFFGLPVFLTTYSSTFIQVILTVWILSYVEKWVKKVVPTVVSNFFVPFLVTLIMVVIMFVATGPLGGYLSGAIESFVIWVKETTGGLAPAIITFLGPWIAMGGMHLALVPFAIQQIATVGYDDLINVWFLCFTISAGAVSLAVLLKTKNKNLRQLAIPAAISGLFGGISEPSVYGIGMKLVKPYWANLIASSIAALYAGLVHLKAYAFGAYSLTSLLAYMGTTGDRENFIHACITVAIDIVLTVILVYAFGFDDSIFGEDDEESSVEAQIKDGQLSIPVVGKYIKQADLKDNTFRQGYLGSCFGIVPAESDIYSPIDGVVSVVQETKHAIGIVGENGAEVLIHIGVDSVTLKGEGLENFVKVGDKVTTKTKIASFSKQVFDEKNIDSTIIVAVTNSEAFKAVSFKETPNVAIGEIVAEINA